MPAILAGLFFFHNVVPTLPNREVVVACPSSFNSATCHDCLLLGIHLFSRRSKCAFFRRFVFYNSRHPFGVINYRVFSAFFQDAGNDAKISPWAHREISCLNSQGFCRVLLVRHSTVLLHQSLSFSGGALVLARPEYEEGTGMMNDVLGLIFGRRQETGSIR